MRGRCALQPKKSPSHIRDCSPEWVDGHCHTPMQREPLGSAYVLDDVKSIIAEIVHPGRNTYPCLDKNRYGLFATTAGRGTADRKLVSKSFSEDLNNLSGRLSDAEQINGFIEPPEFHRSVIADHLVEAFH
jgi:hypothetical protein